MNPLVAHQLLTTGFFVTELEKFAERFHLALLDVCELYRVVSLKLAGHDIDKPTVLNTLTKDGLVRFPIS